MEKLEGDCGTHRWSRMSKKGKNRSCDLPKEEILMG